MGRAFGTAVKIPLGILISHIGVPEFEFQLHFPSSFLIMCTLIGSRHWLKELGP